MSAKVLGMLHTYQIGVLDAADSVDEADADAVVCVCVCVCVCALYVRDSKHHDIHLDCGVRVFTILTLTVVCAVLGGRICRRAYAACHTEGAAGQALVQRDKG